LKDKKLIKYLLTVKSEQYTHIGLTLKLRAAHNFAFWYNSLHEKASA